MIKVKIKNRLKNSEINIDNFNDDFEKLAKEAARIEGYNNAEISIALVDDREIKSLNSKYRDFDEFTDVLSFPIDDQMLGDIVISVETAKKQAEEFGHSLKREMCYLVTHGILHLFGYDHKTEGEKKQMRQKEKRILSKFDINRNQGE